MTVEITAGWANYIENQVRSGIFPDAQAVIQDALERQRSAQPPAQQPLDDTNPLLGLFRDDPDLMDEIVAQAMHNRRHQPWRTSEDE